MLQSALLILALGLQQPAQQPAAAPAKPHTNSATAADTTKAKAHRRRAAHKAKPAAATPRDTTKSKP